MRKTMMRMKMRRRNSKTVIKIITIMSRTASQRTTKWKKVRKRRMKKESKSRRRKRKARRKTTTKMQRKTLTK